MIMATMKFLQNWKKSFKRKKALKIYMQNQFKGLVQSNCNYIQFHMQLQ